MASSDMYLIMGLEFTCMLLFAALFLIVTKFPFVFKLLFAKTGVFEIQDNGILQITKSRSIAGAMVTKTGTYLYGRNDIVRWSGITCILANKDSDARALNPIIAPVLSLFKQHNVDSLEDVESILKAPLVTPKQYEEMQKERAAQERESA